VFWLLSRSILQPCYSSKAVIRLDYQLLLKSSPQPCCLDPPLSPVRSKSPKLSNKWRPQVVKVSKTEGCDEIWPEMQEMINRERNCLAWSCVSCDLAIWTGRKGLTNWGGYPQRQEGRQVGRHQLPAHFCAFLESSTSRFRDIIEPKLEDTLCGFRPVRSTTDQIFTYQRFLEKSWENAKDVHACFVAVQKASYRIPREKLAEICRIQRWRPPVTNEVHIFIIRILSQCQYR